MKESSAAQMVKTVGTFIEKFNITAPDQQGLKTLADVMQQRELESTTRRFYIATMRTWADAIGRPVDTKTVFPKLPRLKENQTEIIDPSDVTRVIRLGRDPRDQAIMATLFYTGIRVGELCRLKYGSEKEDIDVDLEKRLIYLRNRGAETTKNRRERPVPVVDDLIEYLKPYIAARRDLLVRKQRHNDYFFITRRCEPVRPGTVRSMMYKLKDEVGVKSFHPHLGRHTACTNALENGVDPITCRDIFGWSDFKMMSRYSHGNIKRAQKEFDNKFSYGPSANKKRAE
jgi:integrase